jgi:hypothetical protein
MRMLTEPVWVAMAVWACIAPPARAWGPEGHQTVGAIADALLVGTPAGARVRAILGDTEPLQTASLWADCAKGVGRDAASGAFHYAINTRFAECQPFESDTGQQAMVAYVQRNWDGCHPQPDQEACHKQYHYADVAIERGAYARTEVGTSDHDIVSAINAAVAVLRGRAPPPPLAIVGRQEALRVLAHLVGDIHQPLHVGAIYLDAAGTGAAICCCTVAGDCTRNGTRFQNDSRSRSFRTRASVPPPG